MSRHAYGPLPDDLPGPKRQHREVISGYGRTAFACREADHRREAGFQGAGPDHGGRDRAGELAADCATGAGGTNLYPSNFQCNPSSVDGLGITATIHNSVRSLRKLGRHVQIGQPNPCGPPGYTTDSFGVEGAQVSGTAGSIISQGSQFGLGTYFLKYSREYESQADLLGAQIMSRVGYDARDMAAMFRTIEKTGGGGGPDHLPRRQGHRDADAVQRLGGHHLRQPPQGHRHVHPVGVLAEGRAGLRRDRALDGAGGRVRPPALLPLPGAGDPPRRRDLRPGRRGWRPGR